jgi:hypothetical protein
MILFFLQEGRETAHKYKKQNNARFSGVIRYGNFHIQKPPPRIGGHNFSSQITTFMAGKQGIRGLFFGHF